MTGRFALTGARIFTGEHWLEHHAVVVQDGAVAGVPPLAELPPDFTCETLPGGLLVPGFIDAQVNGGGGVLFNATPDGETLARMAATHARSGGATALLPTFITDQPARMAAAIAAVRNAIAAGTPGIAGLHLEGPFLSPARHGAHDPALIRTMTDADANTLLGSGIGTLLITVAPENVTPRLIRRLVDGGVIVSLGHSAASYEVAVTAADAGATGVTHVFNAMSQLQSRAPGLVGAALQHGGLWGGVIADGHHVHPATLASALRAKRGPGRLFLVSDAMPPAGHAEAEFRLNGRRVSRQDGALRLDDGTLAGSDLTMHAAVIYAVRHLGVSLDEALRMASRYPAAFLRLDGRGRIAAGARADMVHLDAGLALQTVWIAGRPVVGAA